MSRGWRDLVMRDGDPMGPFPLVSGSKHQNPLGGYLPAAYPDKGPPGSDFDLFVRQALPPGVERVVLSYERGLRATANDPYVALEIIRAANDWTAEEWLGRDSRLYGLILMTASLPIEAAAEIRRVGRNDRMVGIALGANGLGQPFGHPVYHPIYEAAAELGLPVVLQIGSELPAHLRTNPIGGGVAATFAEYQALSSHPLMSHVSSMIVQGVFDLFPTLRVVLVGGGVMWIPAYLWRFDYCYKLLQKEAPWLRALPSEYFLEHVRVAVAQLESPVGRISLGQALEMVGGMESVLMYASCYPNSESQPPFEVAGSLPDRWQSQVLHQNALDTFRWPDTARLEPKLAPLSRNVLRGANE
jgi:predicted TIM-barrel fold metal-dependent hydrolase